MNVFYKLANNHFHPMMTINMHFVPNRVLVIASFWVYLYRPRARGCPSIQYIMCKGKIMSYTVH